MKTRLLLLLLFATSFASAQINVTEGFESGIIPTGWTTDLIDGVVTHSSSCGGTQSARANYYVNPYAIIYTSSYLSNGQAINISYLARKQVGAFFGYKYLYYEVNGSGTWNQIANVYSDFSTCTPVNATIAAGVIPNGSTVKFRMQVNRASASNTNYVYFDDFVATQLVPLGPQAIAEYSFNSTLNNISGNSPFSSNSSQSYVADRNSNALSALRINGTGSSTTISGLPTGASPRTVSIWYKVSTNSTDNCLFVYGQNSGENAYGVSFNGSNTWYNFAWTTNTSMTNASNDGNWHHLVTTFDAAKTSKIYVDGVLKTTLVQNGWDTSVNSNTFWLAGLFSTAASTFNGTVDDLKIYNYAITESEVTNLFTNNSLSSSDFNVNNLKASLYPNPVQDMLNIEMSSDIQALEIYTLQGQKVMSSTQKQINVSDLASGIYMVRIQDVDGNSTSKKIIKK